MMISKGEIEILKEFNEKVEKLIDLSFTEFVTTKGTKTKISAKIKEEVKVEAILPGGESFDAFVLTFRFFIQNNETISIANMSKLYNKLPVSQDIKDLFNNGRKMLNSALDDKSFLNWNDHTYTLREIRDIIIYGGIAHSNPKYRPIFKKWMQHYIVKPLVLTQFTNILTETLKFLNLVRNLNVKIIEELT